MKHGLEPSTTEPQQPQSHRHAPTRLCECGDTVGITEVCAVLGISRATLHRLRLHRAFIEPLVHLPKRWSTAAVQRFIDGAPPVGLRSQGRKAS